MLHQMTIINLFYIKFKVWYILGNLFTDIIAIYVLSFEMSVNKGITFDSNEKYLSVSLKGEICLKEKYCSTSNFIFNYQTGARHCPRKVWCSTYKYVINILQPQQSCKPNTSIGCVLFSRRIRTELVGF